MENLRVIHHVGFFIGP